jgi:integrase
VLPVKTPESNFIFLTIDELRQLADAEIEGDYAEIQRVVIFACYTGFRVSALKMLTQRHK